MKYAINGLISLTPDGMPILGETPEVKGLWSAAAVWVKEGPGRRQVGRRVDGARRVAHRPPHVRHQPLPRPPEDAGAREGAHVRGVPEDLRDRPSVRAVGERARDLRARRCTSSSRSSAPSSTRPWAGSGRSGTRRTRHSSSGTASSRARPSGTRAGGRRSSTPSTSRCARTPASSTCRPSRSSTCRGRGRSTRSSVQCSRRWTSPVGRVVYTPVLSPGGGFKSDLTIMRLGDETFRIVTGGAHGMADRKLFVDALPERRLGLARGRDDRVDDDRALGPAGARRPLERDLRRRLARGLPVRALPHGRDRLTARARVADLLRRRPRLGALRARWSRARDSGARSGRRASRTG